MTDFAKTMHDWRRMCKYYEHVDDGNPCDPCPLFGKCGAIFEMDEETDWEEYEDIIDKWAEEHPELRWIDILKQYGIVDKYESAISMEKLYQNIPDKLVLATKLN